MAKPLESDFINAHLATSRVLMRKMFETLRDRPQSKYFKNIIIKDVAWSEKTFLSDSTPLNFPPKFLEKYPYDCEISFTSLGCNMLKCYNNDCNNNNNKSLLFQPVLINDYILGGGEACLGIYKEFEDYLTEEFNLNMNNNNNDDDDKADKDNNNNNDDDDDDDGDNGEEKEKEKEDEPKEIETPKRRRRRRRKRVCEDGDYGIDDDDLIINKNTKPIPFETFSIFDSDKNCHYCGVQLTPLKTFSILPSSRWSDDNNMSAREYVEKYKKTAPLQLRELAGLVDAPPLTWVKETQNVRFNKSYCTRFNKMYSSSDDVCYHHFIRTGFNYLFGENFINNAFPNLENMLINGSLPFEHLHDLINGHGLDIDAGYEEKPVSQTEFEKRIHVDQPDVTTNRTSVIPSYLEKKRTVFATHVNNAFVDIVEQIAKDAAVEMSLTALPSVAARLLKHYSSKFLARALVVQHATSLPVSIRLFSLTARMAINQAALKLTIKMLTFISSAANILFAVTLVTILPDILLSYYNVGGFNNEITRKNLNERRKLTLQSILKHANEQYGDQLMNFVVLNNGEYVSPIISPEFIYNLCLLNFLERYPDKGADICHNGLANEDKYERVALDYIQNLEINILGQRIRYKKTKEMDKDDDDEDEEDDDKAFIHSIIKHNNDNENEKNKNNYNFDKILSSFIIDYQIDAYILFFATLLLIITCCALLLNLNYSPLACNLLYVSILFYLTWFTLFLPLFQ